LGIVVAGYIVSGTYAMSRDAEPHEFGGGGAPGAPAPGKNGPAPGTSNVRYR